MSNVPVYDYAVRYCMTRKSYAFEDGLQLADGHWHELSEATRRDVVAAVRGQKIDRYPNIASAVFA